ncbi:MAG: response regulator [Bryobacteraceae bacterium]
MENVSVLLISPFDSDQRLLASIFTRSKWRLAAATNLDTAREILSSQPPSIVVTEDRFPGGNWEAVLDVVTCAGPVRPRVIVVSRLADDNLWQRVLDAGGYDVLEKPFEQESLFLSISQAWRQWQCESTRIRTARLPVDEAAVTLAAS